MARSLRWDKARKGYGGDAERIGRELRRGPDLEPDRGQTKTKPINRLLFDNHQWAVTSFGLESLAPTELHQFEIAASDLVQMQNNRAPYLYYWPLQVAKEAWVDVDAFEEAFAEALKIHARKYAPRMDEKILQASITKARSVARRRLRLS